MNPQQPRTTQARSSLGYKDEPGRIIGLRVERPLHASEAPAASPAVVLCHGFKGFMDWGFFPWLSSMLAESGFVVVSFNASGSGVGDDPLEMDDEEAFFRDTYTRQLEDIARVRAFTRELPEVDPEAIALLGHSRGGGMALISAAEDPCAALVTWAAIDDADRFDGPTKAQWRKDGELRIPNARTGQTHRLSTAALEDLEVNAKRLDILAAAERYAGPYLAVHGREDLTVPWQAAERLAQRAPNGRSLILDGANHGLDATHPLGEKRPAALMCAAEASLEHLRILLDRRG